MKESAMLLTAAKKNWSKTASCKEDFKNVEQNLFLACCLYTWNVTNIL
jgi:hypothetical protein